MNKLKTASLPLILAIVLFGCYSNPLKIVEYNKIDKKLVEQAEKIYFEFFKSCEKDSIALFVNHEFITPQIKRKLIKGSHKNICTNIDENFGEITSVDLIESVFLKNLYTVLRCKLRSNNISHPIEFRMTLNIENKLTDIDFYLWYDEYSPKLPKINLKNE